MESLQPRGEKVKKAIKWISEAMEEERDTPVHWLLDRACLRFNLSPKDEEFLRRFFQGASRP